MKSILPKILLTAAIMIAMTPVALAAGPGKIGYDITLQLANIGIVISLIVIGFATILHRETFSMHHHLPRLLLVAVFINFSWFVAVDGIINLSNKLGSAFLGGVFSVEAVKALSGGLLGGIHFPTSFTDGLSSLVMIILSPIASALFGLLLVFSLIATAIMMFIRYLALNILLSVMPIAILGIIFPHFSLLADIWKKWQDNFVKWTLFYPAAMFFLFIATQVAATNVYDPDVNVAGAFLGPIFHLLLVCGLMVGGLMVANQLGLKGAGLANMAGAWAAQKAAGVAGRVIKRTAQAPGKKISAWRERVQSSAGITPQLLQAHEASVAIGGPGYLSLQQEAAMKRGKVAEKVATVAGKPFAALGEKGIKMGGHEDKPMKDYFKASGEEILKKDKQTGEWGPGKFAAKFGRKSWKELKGVFGDLEGGPLGDLFGKSKKEQYEDKKTLALKLQKEEQAKYEKPLKDLVKLSERQIEQFKEFKEEDKKIFLNFINKKNANPTTPEDIALRDKQLRRLKTLGITNADTLTTIDDNEIAKIRKALTRDRTIGIIFDNLDKAQAEEEDDRLKALKEPVKASTGGGGKGH